MAVTKRTRFEVLKRDNFTCRYCRSADNAMTIDHVVPVALGGSDAPDNLVAACKDCNAGKSSTSPDAELVADVSEDAVRWAKAMQAAVLQALHAMDERDAFVRKFIDAWEVYTSNFDYLPEDWEEPLFRWHKEGVPHAFVTDAVFIAWGKPYVPPRDKFRYVIGIVRNRMAEVHDKALELVREEANDG